MSNIYILEPPTSGKVLLKTTVGDIDIELWAKETPKSCRNFIQLCMEGYYDGTIFHRVVKDFIVQGGDPNGDGTGGESIYGEPFKDEFHQRLRFVRRGLVAMANSDKDDNGSQFFFTLAAAPELQNKHTIFGKVTGETLFNMLKLGEGLIEDEKPVYPHKIIRTEVLNNPFPDIEPKQKAIKVVEKKKKVKMPGVKNFKLLSFGEEAEEDEEEATLEAKKLSGKSKSTHDALDDPKLSSKTSNIHAQKNYKMSEDKDDDDDAAEEKEEENEVEGEGEEEEKEKEEEAEEEAGPDPEEQLESIRKKLKTGGNSKRMIPRKFQLHEEEHEERKRKHQEIKKEIENIKKEYKKNKLQKEKQETQDKTEEKQKNETLLEYKADHDKYKKMKESFPKKGPSREQFTLDLLAKFRLKLAAAKAKDDTEEDSSKEPEKEDEVEAKTEVEGEKWLTHELHFKDDMPILAKDANTKSDDWFEIYDPRNPLNKRRRGEPANTETDKK